MSQPPKTRRAMDENHQEQNVCEELEELHGNDVDVQQVFLIPSLLDDDRERPQHPEVGLI